MFTLFGAKLVFSVWGLGIGNQGFLKTNTSQGLSLGVGVTFSFLKSVSCSVKFKMELCIKKMQM